MRYVSFMPLAPLDPDAFLAWTWRRHLGKGRPLTLQEWAVMCRASVPEARRFLVSQAAWTRKQQRLAGLWKTG